MLIEFRVENHRSLRDAQALTLEAGRVGDGDDSRPRRVDGHNEMLLPAAVVYGPNASGKSNILSAMAFMREAYSGHTYAGSQTEGFRAPRLPGVASVASHQCLRRYSS